jgi:ligand-binding sensor domain-containing protein/serine phosphatase RsbU (regulator of sigma subunit)
LGLLRSLLFFFPVWILAACNADKEQDDNMAGAIYEAPVEVDLDLVNGYPVNLLSGDTITPLLNSIGDTIPTGIAIELSGTTVYPDSILEQIIPFEGEPVVTPATIDLQLPVPPLTVNEIVRDSVKTSLTRDQPEEYLMINGLGDTLKTGVATPATPEVRQGNWPAVSEGFAPRLRENARVNIMTLDLEQGMINSNVNKTFQDSRGYIWVGTYNGVSRYDGRSWLHFNGEEGLGDYVFAITEDRAGNMWFGTNTKGAIRYDMRTGEISTFNSEGNFPNNSVRDIIEDDQGRIWFGTGAGVSMYEPATDLITHITTNEGLSDNRVPALFQDSRGQIWFSCWEHGVAVLDPASGVYTYYNQPEGLSSNIIGTMTEDREGKLWLASHSGCTVYDPVSQTFSWLTHEHGLLGNSVRGIAVTPDHKVWMGTTLGVSIFDPAKNTMEVYTADDGLGAPIVNSLAVDSAGNTWLSTYGGGISVFPAHKLMRFPGEKNGIPIDYFYSASGDANGNIWLATGAGASVYNDKEQTLTTISRAVNNLQDNSVRCVHVSKSGKIWLGTWSMGLICYDPVMKTLKNINSKNGLVFDSVVRIFEDDDGTLWLGTIRGLANYDPLSGRLINYTDQDGLSGLIIYGFKKDTAGNYWLTSLGGGLSRINKDKNTITHYTEREGLSSNQASNLVLHEDGSVWVSLREGGINRIDFETGKILRFTTAQGLCDDFVHALIKDQQGRIWVSTQMGLNVIEPLTGEQNYRVHTLMKPDGLKGTDFFSAQTFIDKANRGWWGTNKSMMVMDLDDVRFSNAIPKPRLVQLDINETYYDYRKLSDSLKNGIQFSDVALAANYPTGLVLPHDRNHVTFHFVATDWYAPGKIRYQYRLLGMDEKWSPVTDKNYADYRNLPHGDFTFSIRAIGESQVWSEPFDYTFTILPPWWLTVWAKVAYLVLLVLLVFGLVKWRTARLQKRQKELEIEIKHATHEIRKQKELVEEKHKEITDSINYAERIQRSFMATKELLDENLPDYFVFFEPKDIVSGDFYWAGKLTNGNFAWSAADSTGHGVPGAIMSILNISALEKSIETETQPDKILNRTRRIIIDRLKKDGSAEGGKDGMDCSLLVLNPQHTQLTFASAHNQVILIRRGDLIEFSADKMPVGKHQKDTIPFSLQSFDLQKGDTIYALTDGFADQFGGPKGKKFMHKNLKELLLEVSAKTMAEQRVIIRQTLMDWKGDLEQLDDICVIGVRI